MPLLCCLTAGKLCNRKYALNQVPRLLGVESVNDFPCYQWGQGGVTQTKSLWEYYPSEFVVGAPPEFYFYSKTIIWQESFTIGQCRQMFTVRFEVFKSLHW
jgi:hypothetical protein